MSFNILKAIELKQLFIIELKLYQVYQNTNIQKVVELLTEVQFKFIIINDTLRTSIDISINTLLNTAFYLHYIIVSNPTIREHTSNYQSIFGISIITNNLNSFTDNSIEY